MAARPSCHLYFLKAEVFVSIWIALWQENGKILI
jgi:hypothetical protein